MNPSATRPKKATKKEWVGLAILALPCLIYSMDLTALNLAIPQITRDLQPTGTQLLWIVDIYGFFVAGILITIGIVGDRYGRRKTLLWGAVAFGLSSIFASTVRTPEMLILARALLGFAAATVAPSTLSLIRNMFLDERERNFAIGVWSASFYAGAVMGPVIGGVIITYYSWGAIFLAAVPVMLLLLVTGPFLLPEFRNPNAGKFDILSVVYSLIAILSIVYGMKNLATIGLAPASYIPILAGGLVGWLFLRRQLTLKDPMVDLALFRSPVFSTSLSINLICVFVSTGMFLFAGQYLQLVLGMSALEAGIWLAPPGIIMIVLSLLTPRVLQKTTPQLLVITGLLIATVGFMSMTFLTMLPSPWLLIFGIFVYCCGIAPIGMVTSSQIMSSTPPQHAGVASAMAETASEFGGALGIAVLGTIVTAVYRSRLGILGDSGINASALRGAQESLGGAMEIAEGIGGYPGEILGLAAKSAFTGGVSSAALVSAVISLSSAFLVWFVFRARSRSRT